MKLWIFDLKFILTLTLIGIRVTFCYKPYFVDLSLKYMEDRPALFEKVMNDSN